MLNIDFPKKGSQRNVSLSTRQIKHISVTDILKKNNRTNDELKILDEQFSKIKFFSDNKKKMDQESYYKLLRYLSYEKISSNQIVFRQGDMGDKFYVILKGNVDVFVRKPDIELKKKTNKDKLKLSKCFQEFSSQQNIPRKTEEDDENNQNNSVAEMMKSIAKMTENYVKQTPIAEFPESPKLKKSKGTFSEILD